MSRYTTIRVKKETRDTISILGDKNESYDELITRLLTSSLTANEELNKFFEKLTHSQKACFLIGVLESKTYRNAILESPVSEKIKTMTAENIKAVYRDFINQNEVKELGNDSLIQKISAELLTGDIQFLDKDEIKYYYRLGSTLSDQF